MTGTAGWPGPRPCTAGRPRGQARASSCRPRLARSAGSAWGGAPRTMASIAASAGPWPRVRAPSTTDAQAEAGLRGARASSAPPRSPRRRHRPRRSMPWSPVRFFGAAGLALGRRRRRPSSDPAVAAGLRVAALLGRVVGARRARGLGRRARRGRRPALRVRVAVLGPPTSGPARRVRRSTPGPVPLARAWWPSCARSWASSSGGTSLHSPDSRLGAGDRSPWSGRGPRLSGRGPRSYERSCGAAVRPLTSG